MSPWPPPSPGSVYIVAEMACAHEGEPERALAMIDRVQGARPDAIQLQLFAAEKLAAPYHSNYSVLQRLAISYDVWPDIVASVKKYGIDCWATVFDEEAVEVAVRSGVDGIKLHSSDLLNFRMLDLVADTGKPVSLAVGGSTLDEITKAVFRLRQGGKGDPLLLYGFQAYPTAPKDANLRFIDTLRRLFGCPVGYMDHTDGGSQLAYLLPAAAIGAGASVIEKHFTDDRSRKGIDYEAALDAGEFGPFVEAVRGIGRALGDSGVRPMSPAEERYRSVMKKSIVAARPIAEGETITAEDLTFLRAEGGLAPTFTNSLVGKIARRDIAVYEILSAELTTGAETPSEKE